jgi:hypothetical protein
MRKQSHDKKIEKWLRAVFVGSLVMSLPSLLFFYLPMFLPTFFFAGITGGVFLFFISPFCQLLASGCALAIASTYRGRNNPRSFYISAGVLLLASFFWCIFHFSQG